MKLYTEEQVRNMLGGGMQPHWIDEYLEDYKHCELPSDEEIEEMGKDVIVYNDTKRVWFVEGLKFMRDKIQGGNK